MYNNIFEKKTKELLVHYIIHDQEIYICLHYVTVNLQN